MDCLRTLVLDNEDALVQRIATCAGEGGYTSHMPPLERAWRAVVEHLSATLSEVAGGADVAAVDIGFASAWASEMPKRAATLPGFLGMLKCCRQAYTGLVDGAGLAPEDERACRGVIDRVFDRVELATCADWPSQGGAAAEGLMETTREALREKERYASIFESVPNPAALLDAEGRIQDMNRAALELLGPSPISGVVYHSKLKGARLEGVDLARLDGVLSGDEVEIAYEEDRDTGTGPRHFEVRIRRIIDAAGRTSDAVVILNDLTERLKMERVVRDSEERISSLFAHMTEGFADCRLVLDETGEPTDFEFVAVNAAFEEMIGLKADDVVGHSGTALIANAPADGISWLDFYHRAIAAEEPVKITVHSNATDRWYAIAAYRSSDAHVGVVMSDVSDMKRREESLAEARDFYLTLFDALPSPMWRSDTQGRVDYLNKAWCDFTGRSVEDLGEGWLGIVHPEDAERCEATWRSALAARKAFEMEYRIRRADGEYRWVMDIGRPFDDLDGDFCGYLGSCYDITERKVQAQQLAHLATHDSVTGLPNRRVLEEALGRSVARARRGHASALLFLDLDNFKSFNDTLGHLAGDQILADVALVLSNHLRDEDVLVRLGGDEFAILLEGVGAEEGGEIADRMRSAIEEMCFVPHMYNLNLSLSLGLVEIDGTQDFRLALTQADSAMYRAKELGRNQVVVHLPDADELPGAHFRASRIVAQLNAAVRDEGFVVHYQPVVRLATREVVAYEALVRMAGADGEMVFPSEFIAVAERFGIMPELTRWVLEQAIAALAADAAPSVSVNLSPVDLLDEALPAFIESALQRSDVGAGRLTLELTEAAVAPHLMFAERWIARLRAAGCGFVLDGFGAQMSALPLLRNLAVDQVKLDGGLVAAIGSDPGQLAMVQAINTLAAAQGKTVVASYVENDDTLALLRQIGLEFGQGYYLGRPAPDLPDWERRSRGA